MRLLVTFAGGYGHLAPMLPVARAAAASGHDVAVAPRPALLGTVESAGFPAFVTGDPALDPVPARRPLRPIDPAAEDRVLVEGFAGVIARDRAGALASHLERWRPDLVLCDEVDFGAMVAAERAGVPHVSTVSMPAGTFVRRPLLADALAALRAEVGLPADPGLAMLDRHLVLVPAPPSFRDPAAPFPATARHVRPADPEARSSPAVPDPSIPVTARHASRADPGGAPPALARTARVGPRSADSGEGLGEVARRPGRPLVYGSLGTVFNLESGDLFSRVIAALGDLPVDALVTVGDGVDLAGLGRVPRNVRVKPFVPQWAVLPHASVAVTHGGSGGVVGALAHGVPVVALPLGADQPSNAARVEALGVGCVLDAVTATPDQVAVAVTRLLTDTDALAAAGRMRDECASLPAPAEAVRWLEALAAGGAG